MSDGDASREEALKRMLDDVANGRKSVVELLRSPGHGDYWGFVRVQRIAMVVMKHPEALSGFMKDMEQRIAEHGRAIDNEEIAKELARKDGARRFDKLIKARAGRRLILSGANFDECLTQYQKLIAYVEALWAEASDLHLAKKFPLATFTAILVIEEIGKLSDLVYDLIWFDAPRDQPEPATVNRSHRRKHFVGVMSGALINARLDRVLGKKVVAKILHQAESDELEKLRQACLYIDIHEGRPITPDEAVDQQTSTKFVVLAGELLAEVLGHFPWEFERMLDAVIAFERKLGMAEEKITRIARDTQPGGQLLGHGTQ